jgi:nicotinate-nucleotide adenylyltransferase
MGGTFDPPHNGHLLIANEVLLALQLEEVWFMPNNIPPHKKYNQLISNEERVKLLTLAIDNHPDFYIQPIELDREGPSYTYDTIQLLKDKYEDSEFYFIIGADMVEFLPNWHRIDELMSMMTFVGVKRPGYTINTPYTILSVDVPQFDVSSSMLRERFSTYTSTRYLLPENVRQYIEENKLYE